MRVTYIWLGIGSDHCSGFMEAASNPNRSVELFHIWGGLSWRKLQISPEVRSQRKRRYEISANRYYVCDGVSARLTDCVKSVQDV